MKTFVIVACVPCLTMFAPSLWAQDLGPNPRKINVSSTLSSIWMPLLCVTQRLGRK